MLRLVEPLYDIEVKVGNIVPLSQEEKLELILEMLAKIKYYEAEIELFGRRSGGKL